MLMKIVKIFFLFLIILIIFTSPNQTIFAATTTLYPVADTYIDSPWGAWPSGDIYFSPQVVNWVGTDTSVPSNDAQSAIKFDVSSISGIITSAKLRIHIVEAYGTISLNIFKSSTDWVESTTTIPSYDTPSIVSTTITSSDNNSWKEYDVTSFVKTQASGNKLATFVLTGNTSGINQFAYNSREDATNPPGLVINYISYTLSPVDNSVNVGVNNNLVMTFSQSVTIGSGNIVIKKTADDSTVETIAVTSGQVTGSGTNTITINPSTTFAGETGYYVLIDSTAFRDSSNNYFTGISSKTGWNFTTRDITPPTINGLSPLDNAVNVGVNDNLVLTFSENVVVGTGNIIIKKTSDDSTVETINVNEAKVTGGGTNIITINPATTLAGKTGYYVLIDTTAFTDAAGNSFAGISDKTAWNFTTADITSPTVIAFSPADNAINVGTSDNLVITFNKNINIGTGNITIKKTVGDSTVETIDVTGPKVSGGGTTTIIINPATTLENETGYYILIDATAFVDTSGNSYAGISSKTDWNFSTLDQTGPSVTIIKPATGTLFTTGSMVIATVSDAGSGIDPNSIEVRLNGVLSNGANRITGNTLYHISQFTISDGTYTLEVKIRDNAGNLTTAQVTSIQWQNYRKGFGFGRLRFD